MGELKFRRGDIVTVHYLNRKENDPESKKFIGKKGIVLENDTAPWVSFHPDLELIDVEYDEVDSKYCAVYYQSELVRYSEPYDVENIIKDLEDLERKYEK